MQIQSLRYFIELANAGSFYAAAKKTFISQQGLNRSISALENELDLVLVERTRRGVRLTRQGELFLKYAERIVTEYDDFTRDLFEQDRRENQGENPISLHVSYYAAQVASNNPDYVGLLASHSTYHEEPFEKLVPLAETSDGSDLIFLDLQGRSRERILANPSVSFEPIITTQAGFVWKEGSPLGNEMLLHRDAVSHLPVALNAHREMFQFAEWLFEDTPFTDVRMEVANPRMLLETVRQSEGIVALFDSFGFFLALRDDHMNTEGLRFTPLSTPKSFVQVGFLYPRRARVSLRSHHVVNMLKSHLAERCADYFVLYPISEN